MVLEFAASLVLRIEAFAPPKIEGPMITITRYRISLKINELVRTCEVMSRLRNENPGKIGVQNNAYSMHSDAETP
jgi:hypothetical protein